MLVLTGATGAPDRPAPDKPAADRPAADKPLVDRTDKLAARPDPWGSDSNPVKLDDEGRLLCVVDVASRPPAAEPAVSVAAAPSSWPALSDASCAKVVLAWVAVGVSVRLMVARLSRAFEKESSPFASASAAVAEPGGVSRWNVAGGAACSAIRHCLSVHCTAQLSV